MASLDFYINDFENGFLATKSGHSAYSAMPLLVMPTILDRAVLGMDFLTAMGTRIQCGEAIP